MVCLYNGRGWGRHPRSTTTTGGRIGYTAPGMWSSEGQARFRRLLAGVPIPRLVPVRQALSGVREGPVADAVARELARVRLPVGRVALAVGSRGIDRLPEVVEAVAAALQARGCEVVVVPAMGSHGGATAEGQRALLAHLGIDEALGVPIDADMAVEPLVTLPRSGVELVTAKAARRCDAVVPINRVKCHTSFRGPFESGLTKMLAIGLGKHEGARRVHARGWRRFAAVLQEAQPEVWGRLPVPFGVALLENGRGELARLEVVPREAIPTREPELLAEAKGMLPRLPFEHLDVLVVHEAGKDISGLGLDPNVTGRFASDVEGDLDVERMVLLGLTEASAGNAIGAGLCDAITARVAEAMDLESTWINAVTSTSLAAAKVPPVMPDGPTAVRLALATCGATTAKLAYIRHTGALDTFYVSESAAEGLDVVGDAIEADFDRWPEVSSPRG